MAQDNINRRQFFGAGLASGAAVMAGCRNNPEPEITQAEVVKPARAHNNLYSFLDRYQFTDNKGQPITSEQVENLVGDAPATLTFGFARCRKICPEVNANLTAIDRTHQHALKHIVIGTDKYDNDPQHRGAFLDAVRAQGIRPENIILLHPADRTKQDDMQREFDPNGLYPERSAAHLTKIMCFAQGGAYKGNFEGNTSNRSSVIQAYDACMPSGVSRE